MPACGEVAGRCCAPRSPQGSYGFFREYRRRTALILEMNGGEEWFGLRIVGDGDASGSSR
jgi:hypothetical protein